METRNSFSNPSTSRKATERVPTSTVLMILSACITHGKDAEGSFDEILDIPLAPSEPSLWEIYRCLQRHNLAIQVATPTGESPFAWLHASKNATSTFLAPRFVRHGSITSPPTLSSDNAEETVLSAETESFRSCLQHPIPLLTVQPAHYCALLIPHHLGACKDLYTCELCGALLEAFVAADKPICAIGYGVWGLCAPSTFSDGTRNSKQISNHQEYTVDTPKEWYLSRRLLTGVSLIDEYRHPYFGKLPAVLQDVVERKGATFVEFPPDVTSVIVDKNLISGPNEMSTRLCIQNLCFLCTQQTSFKEVL